MWVVAEIRIRILTRGAANPAYFASTSIELPSCKLYSGCCNPSPILPLEIQTQSITIATARQAHFERYADAYTRIPQ